MDEFYNPINKVNIIEQNTLNGTISKIDGTFELELVSKNSLIFSHIAFSSQTVNTKEDFLKVILTSGLQLEEVHIVGSRNNKRLKVDSPVSTDIIDIQNIKKKSEFIEVNQFIQNEIPSFNATKQSGSDGADHIVPATYMFLHMLFIIWIGLMVGDFG